MSWKDLALLINYAELPQQILKIGQNGPQRTGQEGRESSRQKDQSQEPYSYPSIGTKILEIKVGHNVQRYVAREAHSEGRQVVIDQASSEGYVEIHSEDAKKYGVSDGEKIKVATKRGEVITIARVTDDILCGCLFMPFHFHEGPANMLTNDALDPSAKIPEFKVCAATIQKVT